VLLPFVSFRSRPFSSILLLAGSGQDTCDISSGSARPPQLSQGLLLPLSGPRLAILRGMQHQRRAILLLASVVCHPASWVFVGS
jgi:hypothetical protein